MRKTFMDDQFDEWEAYVSGGQPGGKLAAQLMFVCISTPSRQPRQIAHASGDPATAEHESSMLQDIRKGRRTEIAALNGAVVDLGKGFALPTTYNELLCNLIAFIEATRS